MKEIKRRRPDDSIHPVQDFRSNLNNLFRNFFGELESGSLFKSDFAPKIDLSEDEKNIYVRAEIPGAKKEEVEISIKEKLITIKGEKKQEKTEGDPQKIYLKESLYGAFERTFSLPTEVDTEKAKASFKDGILNIEIPKLQTQADNKKITIE